MIIASSARAIISYSTRPRGVIVNDVDHDTDNDDDDGDDDDDDNDDFDCGDDDNIDDDDATIMVSLQLWRENVYFITCLFAE